MTCAVNLLPESCHNARQRAIRRNAWTGIVIAAALLVLGSWPAVRATNRSISRLSGELGSVQAKQSELERQSLRAAIVRSNLLAQGRALTALRQSHPLSARLLQLTELTPSGVVFTEIQGVAPQRELEPAPARPAPQMPAKTANPSASLRAGKQAPPKLQTVLAGQDKAPLVVQMTGFAVDHDELTRLIDALEKVPQWGQVKLVRATREPYGNGIALAFQLECRQTEPQP
jgi:hypothetical protein